MSDKLRHKIERSKRVNVLIICGTVAFIVGVVMGNVLSDSGALPNDLDWCGWSVCRYLD